MIPPRMLRGSSRPRWLPRNAEAPCSFRSLRERSGGHRLIGRRQRRAHVLLDE